MKRFLTLIGLALAGPLAAQTAPQETVTVEKCDNVTVTTATESDLEQLVADAECYARRMTSAANSQRYRLAKAKEISAAATFAEPEPEPMPEPISSGFIPSPSLEGAVAASFGFDVDLGLEPAWGSGSIPEIYHETEGAFRFTCGGDGPLVYDDPVIYPNRPGVSHLHLAWGSYEFDAFTTPETLAAEPRTNCNASEYSLNRSLYWMPALLDDMGRVRRPDLVSVYYKRARSVSPQCTKGSARYMGECVGLPSEIRFVFGWDMNAPNAPVQGASWYCSGGTGKHFSNLDDVFASGCGEGDTLVANTVAPPCWDGKNLDSPDHRSHMAFGSYGSTGVYKCPATHPFVIPQEENKATWTVTADMVTADRKSRIRLASDGMKPDAKPGETLHADYVEKWDPEAKRLWLANCIEKGLSCSGGDLGNGQQLAGAAQPSYGWKIPESRVAIPAR